MKHMRKFLFALVTVYLCACPSVVHAQVPTNELQEIPLVADYDLDSTSYQYCTSTGRNGVPGENWNQGAQKIKTTTGAQTTITSFTASSSAFQQMAVGDFIKVVGAPNTPNSGRQLYTYITAKATADSITVKDALDLETGYPTGASVMYRHPVCGSTSADGWVYVRGYTQANFTVAIDQAVVTGGIDIKFECQDAMLLGSTPVIVYSANYTTFPVSLRLVINEPWNRCRVGFKIGTNDDGGDLTTNLEKIDATFVGKRSFQ